MPEEALSIVAERQLGLVTHAQALEQLTRAAVRTRLERGRWIRIAPGVYRIAGTPKTWLQTALAHVLSCGPHAGVSHLAAAAAYDVPGFKPRRIEVVKRHGANRRVGRLWVHGSRYLPEHHLRQRGPLVVVSPARMLCEIAPHVSAKRLERAVDNVLSMRLADTLTLTRTYEELHVRGRAGMAKLRPIIDERGEGYVAPASELEAEFVALCREWGVEIPERQFDVGDAESWIGRVDMVWRRRWVIIELDGRRNHTALLDREADALRDARLQAEGWTVLRVTWRMLKTRAAEVMRLVMAALAG